LLFFRTDKPDKEKGSKSKDAASSKRAPKPRRPDRPVQQSDDEDEEGTKDGAPRQDVNFHMSSILEYIMIYLIGSKTCLIWQR
jgi:hypothetical protein